MKAISATHRVPDAAVLAVAAGCDALLVCGTDHDVQAAALESIVHAVEDERIPYSRIDDALRRLQAAKERFLGSRVAARGGAGDGRLRDRLAADEHRAIAEEMARFL
jgi:beta-N-acetylhexosaminidase